MKSPSASPTFTRELLIGRIFDYIIIAITNIYGKWKCSYPLHLTIEFLIFVAKILPFVSYAPQNLTRFFP